MWVDEPIYSVPFTITRAADDPQTRPCIIHWNPIEDGFSQSCSMLLCHEPHVLRHNVADPEKLPRHLTPRKVTASDPYFKELVPGSNISWSSSLPAVYLEDAGPAVSYSIL
ncbi:hypothetical protein N7517_000447 [Penicillium concentricum]|uniref:Uncharacterized protein n=1 Tax=Penicillium concentricum TaxID=293559 RepID=A0A9W9SQ45_9EURO|nr:uncharacterized protein N7517_000447 [Penicillium concentricum]KAJ5382536.1 hypothetical protein N7517_000447 [Penicillium concentricum]